MRSSTNKVHTGAVPILPIGSGTHAREITASRKLILLAACCFLVFSGCTPGQTPRKVFIKKIKNKHGFAYQLVVDKKPYIIKGVCYNPVPIGHNHEYDWWQDPAKPWLVDGKLMQAMGVNTIRIYQVGENPESVRQVIRDLYNNYGIRTMLGSWLGFWEYPCPFYADTRFRERIKKEVLDMVGLFKDEPGVLMWILGNENNYSCIGTVNPWSSDEIDKEKDPQKQKTMRSTIYYSYVNELAGLIHTLDPEHPVALGNGELIALDVANTVCPDIDVVACIIYRGKTFGNLFKSLQATFDRPVLLSEFGADSYDAFLKKEDQNMQAFFLESQWRQIYENVWNAPGGVGNCLGGAIFEWSDEWWKHSQDSLEGRSVHDTEPGWSSGSYYFDIKAPKNMNMNEEWFGIVALSPELENGVHKRIPKKAYYVIREFWKDPAAQMKPKAKNHKKKDTHK